MSESKPREASRSPVEASQSPVEASRPLETEAALTLERLRQEVMRERAPQPVPRIKNPSSTISAPAVVAPAVPSPSSAPTAPDRVSPRTGSSGLESKRVQAADRSASSSAVDELLRHRRRGRGKLFGIAGLPRHGKTTLADRLRERAAERPGADQRYNKTERGDVNIYYLPGRRDHHVLVDMAGEDYQVLGDYGRELPELMEAFLWPVLRRLDGLVLLMALPVAWSGWNDPRSSERQVPDPAEQQQMKAASARMVDAHMTLLKYAVAARYARRLRRFPGIGRGRGRNAPPTRDQVDDAFQHAPKYDRPVAVVLSKADLYAAGNRSCLHAPDLPGPPARRRAPSGIVPGESDPLLAAAAHFPRLLDFLERRVRCFKWSFCQALEDRSPDPDPLEADCPADPGAWDLLGGEGVVDFLTRHPWGVPGVSSAMAIRLDRRLRHHAWEAALGGR